MIYGVNWKVLLPLTHRGVTSFTTVGLTRSTGYWFRVCTNLDGLSSTYRPPALVRTPRYDLLGMPAGVTAIATSKTSVEVLWTPTGGDVTGFVIQRLTDARHWATLATVGPTVHFYVDTRLKTGRGPTTTASTRSARSACRLCRWRRRLRRP